MYSIFLPIDEFFNRLAQEHNSFDLSYLSPSLAPAAGLSAPALSATYPGKNKEFGSQHGGGLETVADDVLAKYDGIKDIQEIQFPQMYEHESVSASDSILEPQSSMTVVRKPSSRHVSETPLQRSHKSRTPQNASLKNPWGRKGTLRCERCRQLRRKVSTW